MPLVHVEPYTWVIGERYSGSVFRAIEHINALVTGTHDAGPEDDKIVAWLEWRARYQGGEGGGWSYSSSRVFEGDLRMLARTIVYEYKRGGETR